MLRTENSIWILKLWSGPLRFMCVPLKGFAGNHLLNPTENDGTKENLPL